MHTWITISKSALYHNIHVAERLLNPIELGCVVKCNAYGHGVDLITDVIVRDNPYRYMFTAGAHEALRIKQRHPDARVCAMSFIDIPYDVCVTYGIVCCVYTTSSIISLNAAARSQRTCAYVHLKVDTGMSRLGVHVEEAPAYIAYIRSCSNLYLEGVYTHLADLAITQQPISRAQVRIFHTLYQRHAHGIPYWHAGSSGAVNWLRDFNLARVGSMVYGLVKSDAGWEEMYRNNVSLYPVMSWHARVVATKWVSAGVPVGYDGTYVTVRPTCLAYIPIGYGDGYPRSLSNIGHVYINGCYAPVVGIIAMNMITIDVTDVPEAREQDVVTLLGKMGKIHPMHLARQAERITLELLSNINPDIPRIVET